MSKVVKVAVTGAAGQIGYSLLFRIASGAMLGNQKIVLQLLDLPVAQKTLEGVVMELDDCAFPLIEGIKITDRPEEAFDDADICLLVGSRPRTKGMERRDLLSSNGEIFTVQGKAIAERAKENVKVLVVGNPANTNAFIALETARKVGRTDPLNYTAMLRLDHNRALTQIAKKLKVGTTDINNFVVWGNHSPTMYPDYTHAEVGNKRIKDQIDSNWRDGFIGKVANRGAAIIEARGLSSAASAANAAIDHMRDWILGSNGKWVTMGVSSNGSYGIPKGIVFGFPCICKDGNYEIVEGLEIDSFSKEKIKVTLAELQQEAEVVKELLI